jgi:hypothetical protein
MIFWRESKRSWRREKHRNESSHKHKNESSADNATGWKQVGSRFEEKI